MTPSIVALIPARGGSTRIPRKNVRPLGGHPLIAHTIAAARGADLFAAVVVSTEDEETAAIARHYGAEVPFLRPVEYAGSLSPDIEWVDHALRGLREEGRAFDCFALLRPTSPFRGADTIRRAWSAFLAEAGVDSLRAVERARQHPGKMWVLRGTRMLPLLPFTGPDGTPWHSSQTQALPEVYVQNASLEIAWSRVVLEDGTIAGAAVMPFLTDDVEGFDINDAWDWLIAEEMLRRGEAALPPVAAPPYAGQAVPRG